MAAFTVTVWDWQQLLTGDRLEMIYLFSRLKHLLEYKCYERTADVTAAFRTLERQNQKWRHNTGKFYQSTSPFINKWDHHTVKQINNDFNACERVQRARLVRASQLARSRPRHWRQFRWILRWTWIISPSPSLGELNPSWLYRQLVPCCSVHSAQLWMRLWILTM